MHPRRLGTLLLAGALIAVAGAEAQELSRYDPTQSSCAAIQQLISDEGAVILRWEGPNGLPMFDRFVADSGECGPNESAVATSVPAGDGACNLSVCSPIPAEEAEIDATPVKNGVRKELF